MISDVCVWRGGGSIHVKYQIFLTTCLSLVGPWMWVGCQTGHVSDLKYNLT